MSRPPSGMAKWLSIMKVDEESELMIITAQGKVIRLEASTIRQAGRSTQGVKLIDLGGEDKVTAVSLITRQTEHLLDSAPPTIH